MSAPVDLELSLQRRDADRYALDLRAALPQSDAEARPLDPHTTVTFDRAILRELHLDPVAYGRALSTMLFAEERTRTEFAQACAVAQSEGQPLRLRLSIGADAAELHGLRWETLRDPRDDTPLGLGEQVWFSRYLASADWSKVRPRARNELRSLVVIASPTDLANYGLAPIEVVLQRRVAVEGLRLARATVIGGETRATLDAVTAELHEACDILYVVAHGRMFDGEPWLWLEDETGRAARVSGEYLAARVAEMACRPRLAILLSCMSAGDGNNLALAALGPRLARAGVPAVIAMQGPISMRTTWQFLTALTRELDRDGYIDRAVAVARGAIRDCPDCYAPVLYSRLKSGRLWYVPGFAGDISGFAKWPALVSAVVEGRCTPILGPGLLESYIGTTRELARQWADRHGFPLSPSIRENLPQVAQYLAVDQDVAFVRTKLRETLRAELLKRFEGLVPPAARRPEVTLDYLLQAIGKQRIKSEPIEPHRMLARLPFLIYLTTNPDGLLALALHSAGRNPEVLNCPWHLKTLPDDSDLLKEPSLKQPMVYHLFGRLTEPSSLVVTEDDYFRYLIGVTSNKKLIPALVRSRLAETSLLFLGFRLDEWNFRVFLRSVMNDEVENRRQRNTHVAVQLDLDEDRIAQPDRARRYFEQHLHNDNLSIFWGSAEEFIQELSARVRAARERR